MSSIHKEEKQMHLLPPRVHILGHKKGSISLTLQKDELLRHLRPEGVIGLVYSELLCNSRNEFPQ